MKHLFLSDDKIFYTLEGEGRWVGRPSVFLRLAMCNLTCKGFASPDSPHGCDSYISWSIKNKMTFPQIDDLFKAISIENCGSCSNHLLLGSILKLTGGEPMLQQKALFEYLRTHNDETGALRLRHIDFETNATIVPDEHWVTQTDWSVTFTTSPKLSSNGDPREKAYNPKALAWHADYGSDFKFVVQSDKDLEEIYDQYINAFGISMDNVWLMPCAGSREEHIKNAEVVAEYAKQLNVNFSPRLHLLLWDKALRV